MQHQALYRKWRPRRFTEVVGQDAVTSILRYEVAEKKLSHAYLLCGSRGTGKTTCAKILAKAVNCLHPVNGDPCNECEACRSIDEGTTTDVVEMDGASNNGVDSIRSLRDEVNFTPSSLTYRVYIIDEVHMLSAGAFNALLKTLEEPPAHVIFILATTERHKVLPTIISRCQCYDFRRITTDGLCSRLRQISDAEGITADDDALRLIARLAQGGMRDAISLLELCAGGNERVTVSLVERLSGSAGRSAMIRTVRAVADCDYDALFGEISEVVNSSRDIAVFWSELLSFYRDMLLCRTTPNYARYLDLSEAEAEEIKEVTERFTKETLLAHCRLIGDTLTAMSRAGAGKRVLAEMALLKLCDRSLNPSYEALCERVSRLEAMLAGGNVSVVTATAAPVPPETDAKASAVSESAPATDAKATGNAPPVKEPKKETPEKTSSAPVGKRVREYAEILDSLHIDPMYAPYFKRASAVIEGKTLVLYAAGEFDSLMMENAGLTELLLRATAPYGAPESVKFAVRVGKVEDDLLDDLENS